MCFLLSFFIRAALLGHFFPFGPIPSLMTVAIKVIGRGGSSFFFRGRALLGFLFQFAKSLTKKVGIAAMAKVTFV